MSGDKIINTAELMAVYRELVESGKEVKVAVSGHSMEPFLKEGRDSVILIKCTQPEKGDVVMYKRENGRYILHRVVKVSGDKCFFAGDEQTFVEGPLDKSVVFAKACEVKRKGKTLKKGDFIWEFFEHTWLFMLPIRRFLLKLMKITIYRKKSSNNEKSR